MAALTAGCATPGLPPGVLRADPWLIEGIAGESYLTPHYRICTTIRDPQVLGRLARLMEAAHAQYEQLLPPARADPLPLEIVLLSSDREWQTFARIVAGPAAPLYLRVGSGGYAIGDRFVCRLTSEAALYSVAAHEGLHQYMARHSRSRLPPAIEEGLATTFENVIVTQQDATFDFAHNPRREAALARAKKAGSVLPLGVLIQLHAGDVVGQGEASEAYYGQCWLLAQMLQNDPLYHNGFARLLAATARGETGDLLGSPASLAYRPAAVRPLLQRYVAPDWQLFRSRYELRLNQGDYSPP